MVELLINQSVAEHVNFMSYPKTGKYVGSDYSWVRIFSCTPAKLLNFSSRATRARTMCSSATDFQHSTQVTPL